MFIFKNPRRGKRLGDLLADTRLMLNTLFSSKDVPHEKYL
jgi:hypothetical protein